MDSKPQTIRERIAAPTPRFFKQVRRWSKVIGAIGLALAVPPLGIPAAICTALVTAGTVGTIIASTATEKD